MKQLFILIPMLSAFIISQAQGSFGDIPKTVNYRDAKITDVGVVAADYYLWEVNDSTANKADSVVTAEQYVLWQSKGDFDQQVKIRRENAPKKGSKLKSVSTSEREGCLKDALFATYQYMVFKYEYPSISFQGDSIMLSAIAACPTADDTSVTRDVVIGTHVTITADKQCPSNTTAGFASDDWGILMSLAGGKKIKLGWGSNLFFAIATSSTFIILPGLFPAIWGTIGISAEVVNAEPSSNYNLVILPDYEGYGTTYYRSHPYLYQELTARQVVDATRYGIALYKNDSATQDFRHPLRDDFRTVCCGYSQGGSVALATQRFIEQNGLTDELHLVGSICGDGPYDPISTLMYYVGRDLDNKKMNMAVVLPLIVKGMLDSNPYMKSHRAQEFFSQEFLDTGIMSWLTEKQKTTDDIKEAWAAQAKAGQTTIFDTDGKAMMHDIMNEQCWAYFKSLYDQYKDNYTTTGVPLPQHRGVIEDLHLAIASNDITTGWSPSHSIMLFHSTDDTVVPKTNFDKAVYAIGQESSSDWIKQHISQLGHDHVDSGSDFFKGDDDWEILSNYTIRLFTAKKKICDLPWNGQTTSSMPTTW